MRFQVPAITLRRAKPRSYIIVFCFFYCVFFLYLFYFFFAIRNDAACLGISKIQVLTNAMSRSHSSSKLSCLKLSATGSSQQAAGSRQQWVVSRRRSIFIKAEVSQSAVLADTFGLVTQLVGYCEGKRCQLSMMFSISKGNSIITYLSRFALRNRNSELASHW